MIRFIRNLIKRGVVTINVPDSGERPVAQVKYFGNAATIEAIYPYGFCASAPVGSKVVMFNVNGQEENRVGIIYSPQNRFSELSPGEVAVGNQVTQSYIKFDDEGNIEIISTSDLNVTVTGNVNLSVQGNVNVTATTTTINGDVNLGGEGGQGVARIGDSVVDGVITTGSTRVKSL